MDTLNILEKYMYVLSQRELTFDEKVGFITGLESSNTPNDKLPQLAGAVRNILLGRQSRLLHEHGAKAPPPVLRQPPRGAAVIDPATTRVDLEKELGVLQEKSRVALANIMTDENAGDNLQRYGKRMAAIKERLAK